MKMFKNLMITGALVSMVSMNVYGVNTFTNLGALVLGANAAKRLYYSTEGLVTNWNNKDGQFFKATALATGAIATYASEDILKFGYENGKWAKDQTINAFEAIKNGGISAVKNMYKNASAYVSKQPILSYCATAGKYGLYVGAIIAGIKLF